MKNKFKTYLAGAFCGYHGLLDWRDYVKTNVKNEKIEFYDPRHDSNQLCPATFTIDDAYGVLDSDILFHFKRAGYEDDGASWEHGIAFACNLLKSKGLNINKKLLIYVDETKVPFPLHSASADLTFNNLETAVEFLNSMKSLEKRVFMEAWMNLLDRERQRKE